MMDIKLNFNDKIQLSKWIGRDCQFELLYKLSRDGGTAQKFHELCDGKGPTVTVFYNTDNNMYGGYISKSWTNNSQWHKDEQSWLFTLYSSGKWKALKFPVIQGHDSYYGGYGIGPWFNDLRSFNQPVNKTGDYYSLESSPLFGGSSFDLGGENAQSIANGHNNVRDLEVYLVKDGPLEQPIPKRDHPWRDHPDWTMNTSQKLKEYITNYATLEETDVSEVPEANILLIGQVGAGKSSFINTINSIFKGEISARACTGSAENSLTKRFEKFRVRDPATRKFLKLRICDTRGVEEGFSIKSEDLKFILDGNLPNHYTFNPVENATPKVPGFIRDPTLKDKMHVVVFVIDGSTLDVLPEGIVKKLKKMKSFVVDRDIPQIVFLTKMDKVCSQVEEDTSNMFVSEVVENTVSRAAEVIGIPRSHVLPVKNYEKEGELRTNVDILALNALRRALMFADDFLENQYDLEKENARTVNAKE